MQLKKISTFLFLFLPFLSLGQNQHPYWDNVIEVHNFEDTIPYYFVKNDALFSDEWYSLEHPRFWRKVMKFDEETLIINHFQNRSIYGFTTQSNWDQFTDEEKEAKRDSIRKEYGLDQEERIFVTTGKSDFYQFDKVMPSISKGIEIFIEENTDPWYAQAILLIESPGKLEYSNVGALGPFQLMRTVARKHGLTVNKYIDERKDFTKSAQAAASLIRTTCIPEAKRILRSKEIEYNEEDLWFKLFVLHVYHAGSYNVNGVVEKINPSTGGMDLITEMWMNEWGRFKNASQNYTQVALAALFELNEIIELRCSVIMDCDFSNGNAELRTY